ncbi:uncharacterized protein YALI1_E21524g [Yarrowia lipolytica]|uniref:Uncharacterized protein n=1 Tax=Yarrowia lipolytica TaxID=4952 RepID=A0A1D8NIX1_YARLL|nr:hypothetical protein YALI1_E21524g [Yarrowia lipolytica]
MCEFNLTRLLAMCCTWDTHAPWVQLYSTVANPLFQPLRRTASDRLKPLRQRLSAPSLAPCTYDPRYSTPPRIIQEMPLLVQPDGCASGPRSKSVSTWSMRHLKGSWSRRSV